MTYGADLLVPSQYATIQSAIDAAAVGDTVLVAPGSYNERLDMKGKAITLKGANGYTQTILDPLGTAGYLLTAQTGETQAGTIIDGFSFRNSPTGGMKVVSAGLTVKNSRFLGNTAAQGPAIWIQTGNVFVDNTQFVSNVASDRGGAIYSKTTSTLRLNNCVFNGNKSTGTRGGAIYSEATTIDFDGTQFNSNREEAGDESYGGAIYLLTCGGTMDYCSFDSNLATSGAKVVRRYALLRCVQPDTSALRLHELLRVHQSWWKLEPGFGGARRECVSGQRRIACDDGLYVDECEGGVDGVVRWGRVRREHQSSSRARWRSSLEGWVQPSIDALQSSGLHGSGHWEWRGQLLRLWISVQRVH